MVAALVRVFGVRNLAMAEDVAPEAFCRAIRNRGVAISGDEPQRVSLETAAI
jgi:predicted RNA polymerase sigma factor